MESKTDKEIGEMKKKKKKDKKWKIPEGWEFGGQHYWLARWVLFFRLAVSAPFKGFHWSINNHPSDVLDYHHGVAGLASYPFEYSSSYVLDDN
jgi:hypothetical protein